jgi:hypothetical protein
MAGEMKDFSDIGRKHAVPGAVPGSPGLQCMNAVGRQDDCGGNAYVLASFCVGGTSVGSSPSLIQAVYSV